MESQPQNPEFRINPENFHPCLHRDQLDKRFHQVRMASQIQEYMILLPCAINIKINKFLIILIY